MALAVGQALPKVLPKDSPKAATWFTLAPCNQPLSEDQVKLKNKPGVRIQGFNVHSQILTPIKYDPKGNRPLIDYLNTQRKWLRCSPQMWKLRGSGFNDMRKVCERSLIF